MIKNKMRPIHPGEILKNEYLLPLGLSVNKLSMLLHISAPRLNDIVRERRGISSDTALRLARFFNTSAQFWLNLQTSYDLKQTEIKNGDSIHDEVKPIQQTTADKQTLSMHH